MLRTIIADTSCFIILSKIDQLDILKKVYKSVTTTFEVAKEFGDTLPDWVEIASPKDKSKQRILEIQLDIGEASAIALALEIPNSTIILDDFKARLIAEKLGLSVTGTFGVIIKAKKTGIISSVKPLLDKIKRTDFRISSELENLILKEAGE
ncbi:MAG TPA: DUF3368 domain-containing protein [Bacteroidia bacterium]|nr:DUF3368 domain-containing protein [Bacteroidia bacterium]